MSSVIGMCLPVLIYGCGPGEGKDAAMKQKPSLPVMTVHLSDAVVTTFYSSLLEGKVNVEIRPQVVGDRLAFLVSQVLRRIRFKSFLYLRGCLPVWWNPSVLPPGRF